ncbi:MAG: radical SAM protein [Candidatus Diapherotrites archaeon]|nr:radical SAM protein [Candidatus Diapherotrites archaeon]
MASAKTASDNNDSARQMAQMVEAVLGNPLSRDLIKFCTKRCKCGRRVELALEVLSGIKPKLCPKCALASKIINYMITSITKKNNIKDSDLMACIKEPYWRRGLATTLEGIAEFGIKKPFTGSAPFLIVWNITKACNLACKHCYENTHVKAPDELTTQEALDAVDYLAEQGLAYIAVSGGEPLMRPDFFQIAEKMKEKGIALSIATNGTLITKETAKKLKSVNCLYAQVSVDGATAKTHNSFRGRNSFEQTLEGIKNLVAEGIIVGISCTVTRFNIREVEKEIDLAEKIGASIFMHYNFIPVGRGTEIAKYDISPKQREELMLTLAKQNGKRKVTLLSTAPQYARVCSGFSIASLSHFDVFGTNPEMTKSSAFLADFVGGCGTGRLYLAMEPNGDIKPCVFIPIKIGNIKNRNFDKIWREDKSLLELRDRKSFKGNCGYCKFTSSCGGCRARALGYFDSLSAPDPGCVLNQKYWDKIVKGKTKKKKNKKKK